MTQQYNCLDWLHALAVAAYSLKLHVVTVLFLLVILFLQCLYLLMQLLDGSCFNVPSRSCILLFLLGSL